MPESFDADDDESFYSDDESYSNSTEESKFIYDTLKDNNFSDDQIKKSGITKQTNTLENKKTDEEKGKETKEQADFRAKITKTGTQVVGKVGGALKLNADGLVSSDPLVQTAAVLNVIAAGLEPLSEIVNLTSDISKVLNVAGPIGAAIGAICGLISGILAIFGAIKKKKEPSLTEQITDIVKAALREYKMEDIVDHQNSTFFELALATKKIEQLFGALSKVKRVIPPARPREKIKSENPVNDVIKDKLDGLDPIFNANYWDRLATINYLTSQDFSMIGKDLFGMLQTKIEKIQANAFNYDNKNEETKEKDLIDIAKNYCKILSIWVQIASTRNILLSQHMLLLKSYNVNTLAKGLQDQIDYIKLYEKGLLTPWSINSSGVISPYPLYLHPLFWLKWSETNLMNTYFTNIGIRDALSERNMSYVYFRIKSRHSKRYLQWVGDRIDSTPSGSDTGLQFILQRRDQLDKFTIKIDGSHFLVVNPDMTKEGGQYYLPDWEKNGHNKDNFKYFFQQSSEVFSEWSIEIKKDSSLGAYYFISTEIGGKKFYINSTESGLIRFSKPDSADDWEVMDIECVW